MKLKAILKQLRGQHTLPAEEQLFSHFPGHEPGGKRGHSRASVRSGIAALLHGRAPGAEQAVVPLCCRRPRGIQGQAHAG